MSKMLLVFHLVVLQTFCVSSQKYLRADGKTDTYTLINRAFGGNAVEVPDCKHKRKHITQEMDNELKRQVFVFHAHVNEDNDRCRNTDRQRTEIKTHNSSPNLLKGFQNENVSFSWNFKLDAGFQPSKGFTAIHQLKPTGGNDDSLPVIALVFRKGTPSVLQVGHAGPNRQKFNLGTTTLEPFKGTWVHVKEEVTYSTNGIYSVIITRISDGATLFSLRREGLNLWRKGASIIRPKWGIYRSLVDKNSLRDETVRFDTFCIGKDNYRCQ